MNFAWVDEAAAFAAIAALFYAWARGRREDRRDARLERERLIRWRARTEARLDHLEKRRGK